MYDTSKELILLLALLSERYTSMDSLKLFFLGISVSGIVFLYLKHVPKDQRIPPTAPEALPIIGHLLGLAREKSEYYLRLSKICKSPIFSLALPSQKVYVVTSPQLISQVEKMTTTLSWMPVRTKFANFFLDIGPVSRDIAAADLKQENGRHSGLGADTIRAFTHGLMPGENLDEITRSMLQHIMDACDDLETNHQDVTLRLEDWLRQVTTIAATDAIYGPSNPFKDPQVVDALWEFQYNMEKFVFMPLPQIFVKSGTNARAILVDAFQRFFDQDGHLQASHSVQVRYGAYRKNGIPLSDIARYEVGAAIASVFNTGFACFWMLFHIFSRPEITEKIRAELATTTQVHTTDQGTVSNVISIAKTKSQCPLLYATFKEVGRLTTVGFSNREVLQDTLLNGKWLLKKGALVQIPSRCLHMNEEVWGDDVNVMNPNRFLDEHGRLDPRLERSNFLRTFGGGAHLCPGRHFAMNVVLAVSSLLVSRFDMSPRKQPWTQPATGKTGLVQGIMNADTDIEVQLRPRNNCRNQNWKLVMTFD